MGQEFSIQFAASSDEDTKTSINEYAKDYLRNNDNDIKDEAALNAGERIRMGELSKENFLIIYDWKLENFITRKLAHIIKARQNFKTDDIVDALSVALIAKQDRTIIAVLMGLPAVKTRVASAIAAMIWPKRFTVLDVRALHALGVANNADNGSIDFYLEYLTACRALSHRFSVDLRTLDRALFRWSETHKG